MDETWTFNVISGIHNHALTNKLVGHPIVSRLVPEERELVSDMTLHMVAPKKTLAYLKRKILLNVSNIKKIYNMRTRDNKAEKGPRSEMQQLLKLLENDDYVSRYRVCEDKVIIQDIFWIHHDSIKLFNTFPIMLISYSTYKTYKYRLSLLEIVGVTSTKITYLVGFALLESKKVDNVTWILEMCKTMLKDQENMPQVIVTDRNTTPMNLVAIVFPTLFVLLYKYRITKNVRS